MGQSQTVYAEGRTKLSIYDEPQPKVVIVESPTKLEEHIAYAQKYAHSTLEESKGHVYSIHKRVKDFENEVITTVQTTVTDEDFFPNSLFVGVAALAGTIIARRRNLFLRFATSSALAYGASAYLLPKTTHNLGVQWERLENQCPHLKSAHQSVNGVVKCARKEVEGVLAQLKNTVESNKRLLVDQFQSGVGKLKEEALKDKQAFDEIKKDVESMYSTRSNPGVEETLKKSKQ
ncbi:apolipo protein O-domain-containing protein [Spinellus fusiger]|nr:apolipo protein O-domain-containing protein [Spinellus fusiger]